MIINTIKLLLTLFCQFSLSNYNPTYQKTKLNNLYISRYHLTNQYHKIGYPIAYYSSENSHLTEIEGKRQVWQANWQVSMSDDEREGPLVPFSPAALSPLLASRRKDLL